MTFVVGLSRWLLENPVATSLIVSGVLMFIMLVFSAIFLSKDVDKPFRGGD